MAITFTNKAAGEMRERVDKIVGFGSESIWVSTFHSSCVRMLRRFIDRLGYDTNFTIYDTDDQKTLMKDICKRLDIDTKVYKERAILAAISSAKDELISPEEYEEINVMSDFSKRKIALAYKEYQKELKKNNALDFDDLIVKTVELFRSCPDVLEYFQDRFQYIMVDDIRIPIPRSLNLSAFWQKNTAISVLWVMMTSLFISSAGQISGIFWDLRKSFLMQKWCAWNRITVPPRIF